MDFKFRDSSGTEIPVPRVTEAIRAGDTMIFDWFRRVVQICRGNGVGLPRYYYTCLPLVGDKESVRLLADAFRKDAGLAGVTEVDGIEPFWTFRFS